MKFFFFFKYFCTYNPLLHRNGFFSKRAVCYAFLRREYWAIYKYRKYFRKEHWGGVLTTRAVWALRTYVQSILVPKIVVQFYIC